MRNSSNCRPMLTVPPSGSRRSGTALRLLALAFLLTTSSACANRFAAREPIARTLPAAPGFAQPVARPDPRAGESLLVVAKRERQGRIEANGVITRFRDWYSGVRQRYGGG